MPDFGKYKAGSELATGAFTSVCVATRGSSGHAYAIKHLKPAPELWTPREAERQVSAFLARCELQQKAARVGRKYWAPIYAIGREGGGAYYVTDRYPLTAESLIDRHVSLTSAGLYRITLRIVRGLQALDKGCSQAHGNVTPNNVLLRKKGRGNYSVHLSDPAVGVGVGGAAADLQALGALIQALITHKPVDSNRDWTLGGLETYHALGSKAAAWREFVGKLLGVGTQLAFTDLAEVLEALKALRPRSALFKFVAIPGFVLLLGAAVFSIAFPGRVHRWRDRLLGRSPIIAHIDDPTTRPTTKPTGASSTSEPTTRPLVVLNVDHAGEAKRAEEAKRIEDDKRAAEAKRLDEVKRADDEAKRVAEDKRLAEEQRLEKQRMVDAQHADEVRRQEQAKRDEERNKMDAAAQADAQRKAEQAAFKLWVGAITPPVLKTEALQVAWGACHDRWLAALTKPDEKLKVILVQLGEALQAYEQDLPDARLIPELPTALQPTATQKREAILRQLAATVAASPASFPDALSPTNRRAAKDQFEAWVKERVAAAKLIESANAVLKLDPPDVQRELDTLKAIDAWTTAAPIDAAERQDLAALRKSVAALPERRALKVHDLLASARTHDSVLEGRQALKILGEVLAADPQNAEAKRLKLKIATYYDLPAAMPDLLEAADAGSLRAAREAADRYLKGRGVDADPAAAAKYLQICADAGDRDATFSLADIYATGQGVPRDGAKAIDLFTRSADAGNVVAMRRLGQLYAKGDGVPVDTAKALAWFDKAADTGDAAAMIDVGRMHAQAQPPEYQKALAWFQKAAAKGNGEAMAEVASYIAEGRGTPRNPKLAADWYRSAAAAGNPAANFQLGKLAYDQHQKAARGYLEKAAADGNAEAMLYLGMMFKFGELIDQDDAQALRWYARAADAGSIQAMFDLGTMYQTGGAVRQNYAEAVKWLQRAADKGNANAAFSLGVMYQKGQGVTLSPERAAQFFQTAADAGNSNAMRRLATFYQDGFGVAKDPAKSAEWRRKAEDAAAQGR